MYSLPERTVRPAKRAATTVAVRKRNERGTVAAGCQRVAAITAPISMTADAMNARARDS
jgi:hypothetical protein